MDSFVSYGQYGRKGIRWCLKLSYFLPQSIKLCLFPLGGTGLRVRGLSLLESFLNSVGMPKD